VSPFSRCEAAFLKTQTKPDPSGRPPTNDQAPCSIGTNYPRTGETLLFLPYRGVLLLVPGHRQNV
jgi:hypothetical protein